MLKSILGWFGSKPSPRAAAFERARLIHEARLGEGQNEYGFQVSDFQWTEENKPRAALERDLVDAEQFYQIAIDGARADNDMLDVATALRQLGILRHFQRRFEEAEPPLREALAISDASPQLNSAAIQFRSDCSYALGIVLCRLGRLEEGRALLERARSIDGAHLTGGSEAQRAIDLLCANAPAGVKSRD